MALLVPAFEIQANPQSLTEFRESEANRLQWRIVDDGVMGGLSQGRARLTPSETMIFSGLLSLENNGGFSSVRSGQVALDLGNFDGIRLRVKGDGRTYQVRFSTDARYRQRGEVSFKAEFPTRNTEWTEVKIPFSRFIASWRGLILPRTQFDPSKIRRIGLLLGDKKEGPFRLEVDWIRTYSKG